MAVCLVLQGRRGVQGHLGVTAGGDCPTSHPPRWVQAQVTHPAFLLVLVTLMASIYIVFSFNDANGYRFHIFLHDLQGHFYLPNKILNTS